MLWALAAGRCSFPGCSRICIIDGSAERPSAIIGDIAHIVAHSPEGPRGDRDFPNDALDTYDNWILLCPTHHRIVDVQPQQYDAPTLRRWKRDHEGWVAAQLAQPQFGEPPAPQPVSIRLFRVSRSSLDPWQRVPSAVPTYRKWDDPLGHYAVCYASETAAAAVSDLVARHTPAPGLLDRMSEFFGEPITEGSLGAEPGIPAPVLQSHVLAEATVRGRFADFRDPAVRRYVDSHLEPLLGPTDTASMSSLGETRWSQQASRALFEADKWDGILYPSSATTDSNMYALFESATVIAGRVQKLGG